MPPLSNDFLSNWSMQNTALPSRGTAWQIDRASAEWLFFPKKPRRRRTFLKQWFQWPIYPSPSFRSKWTRVRTVTTSQVDFKLGSNRTFHQLKSFKPKCKLTHFLNIGNATHLDPGHMATRFFTCTSRVGVPVSVVCATHTASWLAKLGSPA